MKNLNLKYILFCLIFLNCSFSLFADQKVNASVNQNVAYENENIYLSIKVEDGNGKEEFDFKDQDFFEIKRAGQSSQHTIINGKSNRFISYEFILIPKKIGEYVFPEVIVKSGGKNYSTNSFSGKILSAKESRQEFKNDLWVEFTADKNTVYVDEPIVLRFKIFSKAGFSLYDARYDFPKLTDFIMEAETKDTFEKVLNGMQYVVNEIRTVIYPTRKGEFEIKGASLIGNILKKDKTRRNRRSSVFDMDSFFMDPFSDDPFFSGNITKVPVNLNGDTLKIIVKPLPEENRTDDFNGTVGNYKTKVEFSDLSKVKQGDAITVSIEISGIGHLSAIQEPVFKGTEGFKLFESEINTIPLSEEQSIAGKKIFKKIIIPEKSGNMKLPDINFTYFDPYQEKYISFQEKGREINVQKSENGNFDNKVYDFKPSTQTNKKVEIIGQDILYLHTNPEVLKRNASAISKIYFMFILGFGFILLLGLILFSHIYHTYMTDPAYLRKRKAFSKFKKELHKAKKVFKNDQKQAFSELSKALSSYLSDKTNLNIGTWTSIEIEEKFSNLEKNIKEDLKKSSSILDMGQYGLQSMDKSTWVEFLDNMDKTIKQIEKINLRK